MPRVRASFSWRGEPAAEGYHIFHESAQIADVTGISHEQELDLPYGTHRFSIRGYNRGGNGPFTATSVELAEPMPEPPGSVEGFSVSLAMIGAPGGGPDTGDPNGEPYDLTSGGTRTVPFSYSWPTAPSTSSQVTVTTMADLQTQVANSNIEITISAAFGTQSGNVTVTGDDVDIIMSNSATINGEVSFGSGTRCARVRWTGGNISGGPLGGDNWEDVLIDNVNAQFTGSGTGNWSGSNGYRLAIINSTLQRTGGTGAGDWVMFCQPGNRGDWILANVKFITNGSQNNRFQGLTNFIVVDSVFNPDGNSANGFRIHASTTNVWFNNVIVRGPWLNYPSTGHSSGIINGTFENITKYGNGNTSWVADSTDSNCTVENSTVYRGNGAATLTYAGWTNLGGNSLVAWDGSTFPDVSGYGADH